MYERKSEEEKEFEAASGRSWRHTASAEEVEAADQAAAQAGATWWDERASMSARAKSLLITEDAKWQATQSAQLAGAIKGHVTQSGRAKALGDTPGILLTYNYEMRDVLGNCWLRTFGILAGGLVAKFSPMGNYSQCIPN